MQKPKPRTFENISPTLHFLNLTHHKRDVDTISQNKTPFPISSKYEIDE